MKKESMAVLKDRSVVFWFLNAGVCFGYSTKIEKEKREHAKQHGMIRTEISGAEIAEEMEKERRYFQLQMCEVGVRGGRAAPTRGLGASAEGRWMLLSTFCPSGSLRLLECGIRLI